MKLMIMNKALFITYVAIFFSGTAICGENHHVVVHVQIINKDDGRPLVNKEISLFKWKSYLFGVASKKYLISKEITDSDGRISFSVDERHSLELRLRRCPGDVYGMIYTFTDKDFIKSGRDIILSYSVSKCIKVFGSIQSHNPITINNQQTIKGDGG
jgi:hypothetical protein